MGVLGTYRAAFRGLSREIWILAAVAFVNRCGLMVLPFLALYLTTELGYSVTQAGLFLSLYGAGSLIGIVVGGRLIDRIGFHAVLLGSLVGNGGMLLLLGQLESGATLAPALFVFGFVSDILRPAASVGITHYSGPAERARAFGLFRLAINVGWTIGPAFGGFLALIDYAYLFWIDGTSSILAGLLFWLALPSPGRKSRMDMGDEAAPAHAIPTDSPWRDGTFVFVSAMCMLQTFIYMQVTGTYPLFLAEQRGQPENVIGLLMAVNTVLIILTEMPLIHRLERQDPLRLLGIAGLFIGVGFGLLPFATSLTAIIGTIVLWTIGEMLSFPMMSTWVSKRAGDANIGRYMALQSLTISIALILAPLLGTLVYDELGPDWVWYGCFGVGVTSWVGLRFVMQRGA